MKVIKPGRPQTGWSTEATCTGSGNGNGGCGAVLLVEAADLFITSSHALHESTDYITFRCPCGVLTDLRGTHPRNVWEIARANGPRDPKTGLPRAGGAR